MKPSYNELEAKVLELQNLLKLALERIAALEEQLGKNSKNSSKPPSTDRKPNSNQKKDSTRKSRAGIARPLLPLDQVDHFHVCAR